MYHYSPQCLDTLDWLAFVQRCLFLSGGLYLFGLGSDVQRTWDAGRGNTLVVVDFGLLALVGFGWLYKYQLCMHGKLGHWRFFITSCYMDKSSSVMSLTNVVILVLFSWLIWCMAFEDIYTLYSSRCSCSWEQVGRWDIGNETIPLFTSTLPLFLVFDQWSDLVFCLAMPLPVCAQVRCWRCLLWLIGVGNACWDYINVWSDDVHHWVVL